MWGGATHAAAQASIAARRKPCLPSCLPRLLTLWTYGVLALACRGWWDRAPGGRAKRRREGRLQELPELLPVREPASSLGTQEEGKVAGKHHVVACEVDNVAEAWPVDSVHTIPRHQRAPCRDGRPAH
eukprot:scaffold271571_cov28-Tisochrysis_lutea.AAC.2